MHNSLNVTTFLKLHATFQNKQGSYITGPELGFDLGPKIACFPTQNVH